MADELSAPLGRKRAAKAPKAGASSGLPIARIGFGLVALIVLGVIARIVLVDDPTGGRPVAELAINNSGNSIADSVSAASVPMATITADPEMPIEGSGLSITTIGDDVPDTDMAAAVPGAEAPNANGLYPDLLEASEHGDIPRVSAAGVTPFDAYSTSSVTPATADGKGLIAVIVTGLGLNETSTSSAIQSLPNAVTLAFAPYGTTLSRSAAAARTAGHETLLQVPLEPFDYPESDPGPDTLLTGQAPRDNLEKLFSVMGSFGGYVGLINYMGARFTASTPDFSPIMEELGARGLGYLDDGSSNRSVAQQLATANSVPFGRADRVLDANPSRAAILGQLQALEDKAREEGSAIGVVSALPVSIQTLGEWAGSVADRGIVLVPVSALMQTAQ